MDRKKLAKEFSNIDIVASEEDDESSSSAVAAGGGHGQASTSGWQIAANGIKLALNNRVEDAQALLNNSRSSCIHSQAGYCYLTFINAVMTFEEEKMAVALATMRATEKRCSGGLGGGGGGGGVGSEMSWSPSFSNLQQSVKSKLWSSNRSNSSKTTAAGKGGSSSSSCDSCDLSSQAAVNEAAITALKLEQQIIVADCQVLAAIINFLHQDWGSYMRGGWVLRKAWKIYQRAYSQIRELYMKRVGLSGNTLAPPPPSNVATETPSAAATPMSEAGGVLNGASAATPGAAVASKGGVGFGAAATAAGTSVAASSMNKSGGGSVNSSEATTSSSAESSSPSSGCSPGSSPIREIPSIRSTKNYRGVGTRVSQSLSVPLNLFTLVRSDSTNATNNGSKPDLELIAQNAADLLPAATVKRLMCAVSFGYGIFHLAVSLLPPKLLNIIHFLGFEGDRTTGIQALHFSRQGCDMRGPIATLALLWFHTIVRPFFGLDGSNLRSGADAAQRLIDGSKPDFADSALFLFFQGRVDRLKCNFNSALAAYERALSVSAQREVKLLCLHEVGWSYVLLLQWDKSSTAFLRLKKESRWSKSFYCYLSAVCLGCCGQIRKSLELAMETPSLVKRTNNPLEKFLLRRAQKMLQENIDQNFCLLLGYELLYLWNALGACLKHSHSSIQIDCERISVPSLESVRRLILGSVYSNAGHLLRAKNHYLAAIREGEALGDHHTSAFASYELGMLLCKSAASQETLDEGKYYLTNARDNYQNYDFENRLCVRIHSALRYYSSLKLSPQKVNSAAAPITPPEAGAATNASVSSLSAASAPPVNQTASASRETHM